MTRSAARADALALYAMGYRVTEVECWVRRPAGDPQHGERKWVERDVWDELRAAAAGPEDTHVTRPPKNTEKSKG